MKLCMNCAYMYDDFDEEPCSSCNKSNCDKWVENTPHIRACRNCLYCFADRNLRCYYCVNHNKWEAKE